jgi:hypothetical protein
MTSDPRPGRPAAALDTAARRSAEMGARLAATAALEAYHTLVLPYDTGWTWHIPRVLPVIDGEPIQPLATAIADFGATAAAFARAIHCAAASGSGAAAAAATAKAAGQTDLAVVASIDAAASRDTPDGPASLEHFTHTAALAAFLTGDAIDQHPSRARGDDGQVHHGIVLFPSSWRTLLLGLERRTALLPFPGLVPPRGSRDGLAMAARAARDAAMRCLTAYENCSFDSAGARMACRAARLCTLATTYAGWAAAQAATGIEQAETRGCDRAAYG